MKTKRYWLGFSAGMAIMVVVAGLWLGCGGQAESPDGAHHLEPAQTVTQAIGFMPTPICAEATNTRCDGIATEATTALPLTQPAFLTHCEGNLSYAGSPSLGPSKVYLDEGPKVLHAIAPRCGDHAKICAVSIPWNSWNLGSAHQVTSWPVSASGTPLAPNTERSPALEGAFSTIGFVDAIGGAYTSGLDTFQTYAPTSPVTVLGAQMTSDTTALLNAYPGSSGQMTFYSWAAAGGGAEPCDAPVGGTLWKREGCKRLETGSTNPHLYLNSVNAGNRFDWLDPIAAPPQNELCVFDAIQGPFFSHGSYVDVSIFAMGGGSSRWEINVGDTLEGTPGHTTSIPGAHATCYSYTLSSQ